MSKKHKRIGFVNDMVDIYDTADKGWDTDISSEYVSACGEVKQPRVFVYPEVISKVLYLLNKMDGEEWAADLIGEVIDNDYYITDLYIFEQEVTSVSVIRKEPPPAGYIGTTHSHHHMGAFFSSTDDTYPNENHDLSGVIANDPDGNLPFTMKFTARVKTPCGKYVRFEEVPVYIYAEPTEVDTSKIKKQQPEPVYYRDGYQRFGSHIDDFLMHGLF